MLKKILIGIGIVVVAIFIALMVVNISSYRSQDIKTETQGIYTVYKDEKFGYSFKYPANWTKTNGAPVNQGYVDVTTPDKVTQIQFWYKDSGKLSSLNDLKKFVENDVKYAEENGGFKTVSLSIE
ncbi:MAG: PsbP-related protein, partial [Patescibacteria group bacterium]